MLNCARITYTLRIYFQTVTIYIVVQLQENVLQQTQNRDIQKGVVVFYSLIICSLHTAIGYHNYDCVNSFYILYY